MDVVAFIGPTGTKKAIGLRKWLAIVADVIIDDGLLIKDNKIIAGSSAKYETNKIRSVKRPSLRDDDHADQVRNALAKMQISRVLRWELPEIWWKNYSCAEVATRLASY